MCIFNSKKSILKSIGIILLLTTLTSCTSGGGGEEEVDSFGSISGTGILLEGTVQRNRALTNNTVRIRALDNSEVSASINSNGVFSTEELPDSTPYLMRVDFTSGMPLYALTYERNGQQNINAYSDLAIRNWYAAQGLDINDAFEGSIDTIPTQEQILDQSNVISSLLETALTEYQLSGTDLFTAKYQADNQGIDSFLNNNPVLIVNGDVNIIVTNPSTNQQTLVASNLPLNTDLSITDVNPPSQPMSLRALPSTDSEIVLAWNASLDDIGVTGYKVLRDGVSIAMSTFPAYIDSTVEDNISYLYTVVAVDASGNESVGSEPAIGELSVDITPPPTPVDVNLEPSTNSIRISWNQKMISDVSSFNVISNSISISNTTDTISYQTDLSSGVEYCYKVIAVDGSGNKSAPTEATCTTTLQSEVQAPPVTTEIVSPIADQGEMTIFGQWGGLMTMNSGDTPLVIEIEADGTDGYKGSFSYPTLSLCSGDLEFVTKLDEVYEFVQNSRSYGGDCPKSARVTLTATMFGSEQVWEFQHFDPNTNQADFSGFLHSRSVKPVDLLEDDWGGVITGPNGETPVLFSVESSSGGTMKGNFFYPIRSLCQGSIHFIAKINESYEFYQDSTYFSGECPKNSRVTVSKSTLDSVSVLEFQSLDANTNLIEFSGTLLSRKERPTNPIVGDWGGLVNGLVGQEAMTLSIDLDTKGRLSGKFNYPTRSLCSGSVHIVGKKGNVYEFYQDSSYFSGDCSRNARFKITFPDNGNGQVIDYVLIDPVTNQIETSGSLNRR